jgi:hypothetical protein
MFNITYNKLGIITTGVLTVGTVLYYYYYGGKPPMVTEKQLAVDDVEIDNEN